MVSIDYLRGFTDGEGSFIIRFKEDKRYRAGTNIEVKFNLTQKNKPILERIQNEFRCGKIYYHNRDKLWYLNIIRINDLISFVNLIKDGLYVKKKKAQRFYEVLLMIKNKEHLTKEGVQKIYDFWTTPETDDKPG